MNVAAGLELGRRRRPRNLLHQGSDFGLEAF